MRLALPEGWQWVPLSQIVSKIEAGKSFKCEERPPQGNEHGIVKVSAVTWGAYDEEESKTVTDPDRINEAYLIRPGDFLFSRANTLQLVGACVLVHATHKRLLLSDKILRLVMPDALTPWVLWFLRSAQGRQQIEALSTGNQESMRNIGQERIGRIQIPLPSPATMQRVISRIEELFSEIDEGERALERVQKLLERYRHSLFRAAVSGELTREWRAQRGTMGSSRTSSAIITDTLGELPEGWHKVRIDQAGDVQLGRQRSPAHHQGQHMRPYLRVANVYEERIDISDVMSMNFTPHEFDRFRLRHGDILLNEGQSKELVGRPAMYKEELPGACFTNSLVRFRAGPHVLPEFAMCAFLHFMKSGDFQRIAQVTTNIAHLGATRFGEMGFPLPPLNEQQVIVDAVERQVSVWRAVADELARRRDQSAALRQSILKAAFSGQLLAQLGPDGDSALPVDLADQSNQAQTVPCRSGPAVG